MTEQKKVKSLTPFEVVRKEIESRTGEFLKRNKDKDFVDRFKSAFFTMLTKNSIDSRKDSSKDLLTKNRASLIASLYDCANQGLLPDGKEAALVAYGDVVQFMPIVTGIRKKVMRTGKVKYFEQKVVFEKDKYRYWKDDDGWHLTHEPFLEGNRGKVIFTYSEAILDNDIRSIEVVTEEDMMAIKAKSRKGSFAWNDFSYEMRRVKALRRHAKSLPMTNEVNKLLEYVDNQDDLEAIEAPAEAPAKLLPVENDIQSTIEAEARGEIAEPVKVEAEPAPTPVPKPAPKRKPKPRAKPAPAPAPAPQAPVSQRTKSLF